MLTQNHTHLHVQLRRPYIQKHTFIYRPTLTFRIETYQFFSFLYTRIHSQACARAHTHTHTHIHTHIHILQICKCVCVNSLRDDMRRINAQHKYTNM